MPDPKAAEVPQVDVGGGVLQPMARYSADVPASVVAPAAAPATPAAEPSLEQTMAKSPDVASYTQDGVSVGRRSLLDLITYDGHLQNRAPGRIRATHVRLD